MPFGGCWHTFLGRIAENLGKWRIEEVLGWDQFGPVVYISLYVTAFYRGQGKVTAVSNVKGHTADVYCVALCMSWKEWKGEQRASTFTLAISVLADYPVTDSVIRQLCSLHTAYRRVWRGVSVWRLQIGGRHCNYLSFFKQPPSRLESCSWDKWRWIRCKPNVWFDSHYCSCIRPIAVGVDQRSVQYLLQGNPIGLALKKAWLYDGESWTFIWIGDWISFCKFTKEDK